MSCSPQAVIGRPLCVSNFRTLRDRAGRWGVMARGHLYCRGANAPYALDLVCSCSRANGEGGLGKTHLTVVAIALGTARKPRFEVVAVTIRTANAVRR